MQSSAGQVGKDGAVSMNEKKTAGKGGMGFVGVLTLIFIVLKFINWSWLWVLSPIWITALLLLALFGAIFVAAKLKNGKR